MWNQIGGTWRNRLNCMPAGDAAELEGASRKISLLVRYCAHLGSRGNADIALHMRQEIDKLETRYRELTGARQQR